MNDKTDPVAELATFLGTTAEEMTQSVAVSKEFSDAVVMQLLDVVAKAVKSPEAKQFPKPILQFLASDAIAQVFAATVAGCPQLLQKMVFDNLLCWMEKEEARAQAYLATRRAAASAREAVN